jgi:hypothetical protein
MTINYAVWKGWGPNDFGQFDNLDAEYFSAELNECGLRSVRNMSIGEIGYGNGSFAGWVVANGGKWIGKEAQQELYLRAIASGFNALAPNQEFSVHTEAESLDAVFAFDVLEHLTLVEIKRFLFDASAATRAGGLVVFRIPSGDSPYSGAIFCGDLTHTTLLGSSAVHQLALESHLEVLQIRAPVIPIRWSSPTRAIRRICLRVVQGSIYWFVRTVLMSNSGAVVSPNMLVVLRKRRSKL